MSISKEFLLEAVGLSLLVALILIGMQMFQRTVRITNLLEEQQERKIEELEEYEIIKYDGLLIDGVTALGYIKNMVGEYYLPITVEAEQEKFTITERSEFTLLRDMNSEKYISPYALFQCKVIRDENEVITEVHLLRD